MSDLFHEEVPTLFVGRVLDAIAEAPAHDFLVLTKRPSGCATCSTPTTA
jgi:protein gp37